MAHPILMPRLGDDMTDGKIVNWLKREGDAVALGDIVAEVETDKVTLDIESPVAGVLQHILVREGQSSPVGGQLAVLVAADELASAKQSSVAPVSAAPVHEQPLKIAAPRPEPIQAKSRGVTAPHDLGKPETVHSVHGGVKASPVARRLAEEHGLDLAVMRGSGPGGRVIRDDVLPYLSGVAIGERSRPDVADDHGQAVNGHGRPVQSEAALSDDAESADVLLTRRQQTMGRRMVESKTQIPHLYLTIDADVTDMLVLRQQLNNATGDAAKISVNDLIVKAAARALTQFPVLTSRFAGDRLILAGEVSIAVAVALDDGLVTPVVRNADQKSLGQIANEIKEMAERARAGKGRAGDYEGGTFTVSNLGMYGIETVVPIINPPQASILGVGAVRRLPVYEGDTIVPRDRIQLTVSADHRVTDGATVARFLSNLRDLLAHPLRLVV